MKKVLALLLCAAILLAFAGCDQAAPGGSENTTGAAPGIQSYVMLGGAKVQLGGVFDEALAAALGEPLDVQEAVSCHYDGFDTIYYYDGFAIYTYLFKEDKIIYSIELESTDSKTPEGAAVGMTRAEIEAIYGGEYSELANGISYPLQEAGAQLNIRIKDDRVFLIEYYVE